MSSQSASSSTGHSGSQSDESPDSPIKTSPVSERIKALEALVAKKKEPDFRSDAYSHYRDRHTDKRSSIEIQKAAFEKNEKTSTNAQKKGSPSDKESPDSPFEILGDCKPLRELEDTEEWMKTHIPPKPEFQSSDDIPKILDTNSENVSSKEKQEKTHITPDPPASCANAPDAFMDTPVRSESFEDATIPQNPYAEEECDFDLSFLPTAYMCSQQEKNYDAVVPMSPPAGFETKSSPVSSPGHNENTQFITDPDPPEVAEMDSSGESDDTVIEDGVPVHASATCQSTELQEDVDSTSTVSNISKDEKEAPPTRSERKLMQVPTINVIETDEPNYSDEEMELEAEYEEDKDVKTSKDQDVELSDDTIPESSVEKVFEIHQVENQPVEDYSPSCSPAESDTEFSPKHKAQELSHVGPQEPQSLDNFLAQSKDRLQNKEPVDDFSDHDDDWDDQTMAVAKPINTTPDPASINKHNMDEEACTKAIETSDEAHNAKPSFMRDDIYDRESFDYDYDAPPSPADNGADSEPDFDIDQPYTNPFHVRTEQNAPHSTIKNNNDTNQDSLSKRYPQDPYSIFYTAPVSSSEPDVDNGTRNMNLDDNCNKIKDQEAEKQCAQRDDLISQTKGDQDDQNPASEPADSFVEFMRECLKSRQDEETHHTEDCLISNTLQDVHSFPSVAEDYEHEKQTISALKELGSSQDEEMESVLPSAAPYQAEPSTSFSLSSTQSTVPCPPSAQSTSFQPCAAPDSTYAREVEAIDEWVAEAYHLAEHVLTAVLTHLSGNLFFPTR